MNLDVDLNKTLTRTRRNTLSDLLTRTKERYPDKFALAYKGQRVNYAELDALVNQSAATFLENNIKQGDMVVIMSKNSLDFVVVKHALARIGAVMIPINYMLTAKEVQYILEHANVSAYLASPTYAKVLDEAGESLTIKSRFLMDTNEEHDNLTEWIPLGKAREKTSSDLVDAPIEDDDLAQVLYTSGTESLPKGVMLSHKSIISEYVSCVFNGEMNTDDVVIHALPMYHSAQMHCFLGPSVYVGSSGIILEAADPKSILETIEKEGVTLLFCPPTVWIALLRHPDFDSYDLSTLEKCYYGAAIMPREVLKELAERLPNARFWNFYGQTEVAPLATVLGPEDQLRKLGSAGKPSLNMQTRIVDENNEELPRGEVGEIVHRTPHAMKGYLYDPEKTAEVFKDGWFHSGDLGVIDEEGYLTIVDRKKDMINTGGVNVSSREVEETIYEMDGVAEVAVIGVPDPYWIEAVSAVVVMKKDVTMTEEEVTEFCKKHLSKFKVPKEIHFVDELPKNTSGKILKRSLRDQFDEE